MRERFPALLAVLALLVGAAFIAGCGGDDDEDETAAGDLGLIQEGTLTVGSDIPFPPFEQGKAPNYEGFDIDLTNEVANRLDLEVAYQDTAFDTIFRDLAQGKFDMVASATTITPEREQTVDFSDPYFEAEQSLMVPEGSDIATVEDLGGATVGAQDGTTGEDYANDETDAAQVRGFPEAADAFNALRAGQVDAVIIDNFAAQDAVEQGIGGIGIAAEIPTGELYGLPVAQGNDALLEAINEALQEIKDDETLNEIYQEHIGTEAPTSVLEGTHEPS
jgi:polar amino acid transport system substrate-binding protein